MPTELIKGIVYCKQKKWYFVCKVHVQMPRDVIVVFSRVQSQMIGLFWSS